MKIQNRGIFYKYSIWIIKFKIFKVLRTDLAFKQRKKVFPESLQNLSFNRNKTEPKFALSVQL